MDKKTSSKDAEDIISEYQKSNPEQESEVVEKFPENKEEISPSESKSENDESSKVIDSPPKDSEISTEGSSSSDQDNKQISTESENPPKNVEVTSQESTEQSSENTGERDRNVIFVGNKPIMTYVTATLTQLSSEPVVTIKARGKRITQAVDVSQMIVKRMDSVGYKVKDVRISSDSLTSQDGKLRNVSTIEIDVVKVQEN